MRADATAQKFQVRFPADFTCNDCTLRLLRQADEWSNGYRFWSCADIDIKNRMSSLFINTLDSGQNVTSPRDMS